MNFQGNKFVTFIFASFLNRDKLLEKKLLPKRKWFPLRLESRFGKIVYCQGNQLGSIKTFSPIKHSRTTRRLPIHLKICFTNYFNEIKVESHVCGKEQKNIGQK